MILYINGQEIERLVLGLVKKEGVVFSFTFRPTAHQSSPERFLPDIVSYLADHNLKLNGLTGVILVSGEGSATSLRGTHAIGNALAFTEGIPLFNLEKKKSESDEEVLSRIHEAPHDFARVKYEKAPHITVSKKDALKR